MCASDVRVSVCVSQSPEKKTVMQDLVSRLDLVESAALSLSRIGMIPMGEGKEVGPGGGQGVGDKTAMGGSLPAAALQADGLYSCSQLYCKASCCISNDGLRLPTKPGSDGTSLHLT